MYIHKGILKFNVIFDLNMYNIYIYKAWYNNIYPQLIKLFNK